MTKCGRGLIVIGGSMSEVLTARRITINGNEVINFICSYHLDEFGVHIDCVSYNMLTNTYEYDVTCTEEDISYIKLKYG